MLVRCENCFLEYNKADAACPHCGHVKGAMAAERIYLRPGTVLKERYAIGQVVGSGGFGIIYKALDRQTNTIVAVKEFFQSGLVSRATDTQHIILVASGRKDEFFEGKKRFYDEAVNTRRFAGHPNIVTVLDVFEENNTLYLVMEFLRGETLGDYAEKNKLTIDEKISIVMQVGDALSELHKAGILHRDVSPDNIIVPYTYPKDGIKLFDFGAARFSRYEMETLQTRVMKPGFSPPEQYGPGSEQNAQIDVYALGATLYYLLTDMKPEESTNRRIDDNLPSPKALNDEIPENISNAILTAMALDLHLRFKTIKDFQTALVSKVEVLPPKKKMHKLKKRRRRIILSAAAVIVIGFAIYGAIFMREIDRTTLPDSTINILYCVTGDEAVDSAKLNALTLIIEEFKGIYPNVEVELKGINEEDYAKRIDSYFKRGDYSAVFESTMMSQDNLEKAINVSGIIGNDQRDGCYFLGNYARYFPDKQQMPVGFSASSVYINRQLCAYEPYGVKEISALFAEMPFAVSEKGISCDESNFEYYRSVFDSGITMATRDSFVQNVTGAYFSDTAEYYRLLKDMPGRFRVLYVEKNSVPAKFGSLWSVMPGNSDGQKSALRFLQYMLSENAQYYLHISNQSGLLPINKKAIENYSGIYVDYSAFFANMDKYTFK